MSQLPITEGALGQVSGEELVSLLERAINQGSQQEYNEGFDSIIHTKMRGPKRKGPSYRKINRYFKSISQYKKERERRKQVLHYSLVEYRTQQWIADKLGVSRSTIKRDFAKLRGYIVRQNNRAIRQFQEEQRQRFEQRVEGLSLRERFDVLSEEMDRIREMQKSRYHGHYTILHLDMTQPDEYGLPKLTVLPHQTRGKPLAYPYKIRVVIKGRYEDKLFEADLGGFNIIQKTVY